MAIEDNHVQPRLEIGLNQLRGSWGLGLTFAVLFFSQSGADAHYRGGSCSS
jgi:hypothetical protein